jgi:hypothetical protein
VRVLNFESPLHLYASQSDTLELQSQLLELQCDCKSRALARRASTVRSRQEKSTFPVKGFHECKQGSLSPRTSRKIAKSAEVLSALETRHAPTQGCVAKVGISSERWVTVGAVFPCSRETLNHVVERRYKGSPGKKLRPPHTCGACPTTTSRVRFLLTLYVPKEYLHLRAPEPDSVPAALIGTPHDQ